jgi:hypothetical protein
MSIIHNFIDIKGKLVFGINHINKKCLLEVKYL